MAAITYVYAAERNAPVAYLWFLSFVMPADCNHMSALLLASISTGSVMMLNRVVNAKSIMPPKSRNGNTPMSRTPKSSTHDTMLEENDTTGTSAERSFNGP